MLELLPPQLNTKGFERVALVANEIERRNWFL